MKDSTGKRRHLVNNQSFIDMHLHKTVKTRPGFDKIKYTKHHNWNTLHFRHILAPYTYVLVWDYGTKSITGFNKLKSLNVDVPYMLYAIDRRTMTGLLQGFLTSDDMQYARRKINREDALIAYTIDNELKE